MRSIICPFQYTGRGWWRHWLIGIRAIWRWSELYNHQSCQVVDQITMIGNKWRRSVANGGIRADKDATYTGTLTTMGLEALDLGVDVPFDGFGPG